MKNKKYLVEILLFFFITIPVIFLVINDNPKLTEISPSEAERVQIPPIEVKNDTVGQILPKKALVGVGSWYSYELNGIEWSKTHNTCASRDFKRYSTIRVTNLANDKSVNCYVNDWVENKKVIIDLSRHAFNEIADLRLGLINVRVEEIQ